MAKQSVPLKLDPQAVAEAISHELERTIKLAPTEHYVEVFWRENPLNYSITNRLAAVDRCLAATYAIQRLLHRDRIGKQEVSDQCDEDEVKYLHTELRPDEIDGLHLGMNELMQQAQESLRSIREDEYSIATKQSKGER